ncbi:MAG: hypothetical protein AB7O32_00250 [Vicinamibacterales bacterium]
MTTLSGLARQFLPLRRDPVWVPIYASATTNVIINNIAAGPSYLSTQLTIALDLSWATHFRVVANINIAAASGGTLRLRASPDNSSYADAEDNGATDADLPITATGLIVGQWGRLSRAARIRTCYLRLAGFGGNGNDDPAFRVFGVELQQI